MKAFERRARDESDRGGNHRVQPYVERLFVLRQPSKQIKQNLEELDRAISDFATGRDISWARTGRTSRIQRVAVRADKLAGRDLQWARESKIARVRKSAAHADYDLGNDLSWTKNDLSTGVRKYFGKQKA